MNTCRLQSLARRIAGVLLALFGWGHIHVHASTVVPLPLQDIPGQPPTLISNVPPNLTNAIALSGYFYGMALRANGRVTVWGNPLHLSSHPGLFQVPADLTNAVAISDRGLRHALAVRSDGTVVGWGDRQYGKSEPPTLLGGVLKVAAGQDYSLALKKDGTVVAWGGHWFNETILPGGLNDVVDVTSGGAYSLALRRNGTVVAWGYNASGQTDVPTYVSNVVAIAASYYTAAALRSDGTVVWWGSYSPTNYGQPVGWSNIIDVAWDRTGDLLGLKSDGTLARWPGVYPDPPITSLSNVVALSDGDGQGCLVLVRSPDEPFIIEHPQSRTVAPGSSVEFRVSAVANQPLSYQWQFNNMNLRGATNRTLAIHSAWLAQIGHYRAVVTAAGLPVKSRPALLLLTPAADP